MYDLWYISIPVAIVLGLLGIYWFANKYQRYDKDPSNSANAGRFQKFKNFLTAGESFHDDNSDTASEDIQTVLIPGNQASETLSISPPTNLPLAELESEIGVPALAVIVLVFGVLVFVRAIWKKCRYSGEKNNAKKKASKKTTETTDAGFSAFEADADEGENEDLNELFSNEEN